jgi:short-subunit dehydrogenase
MQINGRTALITGASSGIGAATARAIARKGGRVILLARTKSALESLAAEITASGGQTHAYPVDLSDAQAVDQTAKAIAVEIGTPDILINNAGAGRWLFVEETSPEEMVSMMAVPYFAAFYVTRAFLPDMLRRNSGHIVMVTSPASRIAWPGATAYSVARWAMRGFSEALRADLRGTGIQVTLFTSGKVTSSYFENNPGSEERLPGVSRLVPTIIPEQAADAIVRGIERNKREVVVPLMLKLFYLQHNVVPRFIEWLVAVTGWKHRLPPR